jgi:hypothetical protein
MPCQHVTIPGGRSAIVCGTRTNHRCKCGRRATRLCDWKVPERKSGTCDTPVCTSCSTKPAPDKDLCTEHALAYGLWKAGRR